MSPRPFGIEGSFSTLDSVRFAGEMDEADYAKG